MKVCVTGSGGLIGSALVRRLETDGHQVVRLVRTGSGPPAPGTATWDPSTGVVEPSALDRTGAVVHLAGAGIGDRRWSESYKRTLLRSRVDGTTTIAQAVAGRGREAPALISGSAIGYYGNDRGDTVLTEDDAPGTDFLARLCVEWESATAPARQAGARVVHLRTGLVLSAAGGVLARQLPLFRLGVGGRLGAGRQYQSWITRHDEVAAIVHALNDDSLSGPLNLTAPGAVTNAEMASAIGQALRRPSFLSVPAPAMRLAFGREMADETVLAGQRVIPARLQASGFHFAHADLRDALRAALADRAK
ncbi:MAG TPA: TIGR01777 family oxidoreductase [Acidimicrobiales bacterium]|nr:TIGR01777 family oxidoreductase [Acidimicrobiales bacterium]